jgi:2-keto-4-pentenoate hydratase/2-oxohepta-3-ene-1,7-dioic acid hydratase in catechol pathway
MAMKLVLFDDFRPGVLVEGGVVDCSALLPGVSGPTTMTSVIEGWGALRSEFERLAANGPVVAIDESRLRAPVAKPGKIMCMAANFREGTGAAPLPINGFVVSPEAVLDPGETLVFPPQDFSIVHHEAELVCVIGKAGHNISEADAMDHVFGFTAGVDVSARASEAVSWGFLGKACDGFKPLGPCIVTPDELGDPHALQVQLSVDGALRQDYNTSDIGHKIPECIAWFSSLMTMLPGDLLFIGTNHQQLGPLQDGEHAEMSIEGIGSFTFSVSDPKKRSWPKGIDLSVGNSVRGRIEEQAAKR